MIAEKNKNLIPRPPVVVILGHVDHGKSSILEAVKDIKITENESGGITQHIGAYEIEHNDKKITFIDTPGHEAFSSMRSRGAKVADIAVLVVAADEGVKPQTEEAISHIKKADIPMIVAINKIDKPEANVERVAQQLAEKEVYLESLGGKIPSASISAKKKQGLEDLLELIILTSEIEEISADFSVPAKGIIVESYVDSLEGCVATVIVESGVLEKGNIIATQSSLGKVKGLKNFQQKKIEKAFPSMPAVVCGFNGIPFAGEKFEVFSDMESAQKFVENQKDPEEGKAFDINSSKKTDEQVNLIIKSDFIGSLEAIEGMLNQVPQDRVCLKIIKSEVGNINESDIKTARSGKAEIVGFKVKVNGNVANMADREGINISLFNIIYELVEYVKKLMEKAINPRKEKIDLGKAKIQAIFIQDRNRQIVGCKTIQGEIRKKSFLEIFRMNHETQEEEMIGKGKISNLKKGEKETEKVFQNEECGILFEGNVKLREGDILSSYIEEEEKITGI